MASVPIFAIVQFTMHSMEKSICMRTLAKTKGAQITGANVTYNNLKSLQLCRDAVYVAHAIYTLAYKVSCCL